MEDKETIIRKIENLLALAGNNPNENEAAAAALKAQELMAKYNIGLADTQRKEAQEISREIYESRKGSHSVYKWKYELAAIIAKNFCCKTYYVRRETIVFYGYAEDVKIAKEVFKFLFETGNRLAGRYYRKCRKEGTESKGVMNTYLSGYCDGIKEILDKQCSALMLVIPREVEEAYREHSQGFRRVYNKLRVSNDTRAYQAGKQEGKDMVSAKALEKG